MGQCLGHVRIESRARRDYMRADLVGQGELASSATVMILQPGIDALTIEKMAARCDVWVLEELGDGHPTVWISA